MDVDMSETGPHTDKWFLLNCTRGLIFVCGLSPTVHQSKLHHMMSQFGIVQYAFLCLGEKGTHLGFGYVKFETDEQAQHVLNRPDALATYNEGKTPYLMRSTMEACTRFYDAGKLSVWGFGPQVTVEQLNQTFSQFGALYQIDLSPSRIATVHYLTEYSALFAMQQLNGVQMGGSTMSLCLFGRHLTVMGGTSSDIVLRFFNIDPKIDSRMLREMFKHIGRISGRVETMSDGSSRTTGFVCFPRPAVDTPLLRIFVACTSRSGETLLSLDSLFRVRPSKKKPMLLGNYNKFHPDGIPPHFERMYKIPPEYRPYADQSEDYYPKAAGKPSELNDLFLGYFHLHVTCIDKHTSASLRNYFKRFGEVVFCTIRHEEPNEPYAIVTFKKRHEAIAAVEATRFIRVNGRGMIAELLDSYQFHLQRSYKDPSGRAAPTEFHDGCMFSVDEASGRTARLPLKEMTNVIKWRLHKLAIQLAVKDRKPEEQGREMTAEEVQKYNTGCALQSSEFHKLFKTLNPPSNYQNPAAQQMAFANPYGACYTHTQYVPMYTYNPAATFVVPSMTGYSPYPPPPPQPNVVLPIIAGIPSNPVNPTAGNDPNQQNPVVYYEDASEDKTQDHIRSKLVELLTRLFPKYTIDQRFEALEDVLQAEPEALIYAMRDDQEFRKFVVQRAVARARNLQK